MNVGPRCSWAVQDGLRQLAGQHRVAVIDLPRVLGEWVNGAFPDRRLFMDYCHLTAEGLRVAMAAIAEALLRPDVAVSWREILGRVSSPQALCWRGICCSTADRPYTTALCSTRL